MQSSQLRDGDLGQVSVARRLVSELQREHAGEISDEIAYDAEVVVSELVTNALLHGSAPVAVVVEVTSDHTLRVAVEDAGRALPVMPRDSTEAMTGRGLGLVASLARTWGVDPAGTGKVVWAELDLAGSATAGRTAPDMDLDALLGAWDDDEAQSERRYTVRLGSVPTRLLLSAKEHVDNLVRELTFARASFREDDMPAHLTELTSSVVAGFAEARSSIKRQAIAAAEAGELETQLVLQLPASAVEAGQAYLVGLDEADRYARAARLLTLETPPTHRVFRRWYVESLVEQLRALAAGEPAAPAQTFPERLGEELTALSGLTSVAERIGSLHEISAALSALLPPQQVAQVVVREGTRVLGAYTGGIALGVGEEGDTAPVALVHRTGEPVWIDSQETLRSQYPDLVQYLSTYEPTTVATCAVPVVAGHRLGVLSFSFDKTTLFDNDQRRFVLALADQAAVALERSELYEAERQARADAEDLAERLDLLTRVTADLTGARDVEEVVRIVTLRATEELGAHTARVYLLEEDGMLRSVGQVGGDAQLASQYEQFPVDADLPGGVALRTGVPLLLQGLGELAERFPVLAGVYATERTLLVLPLTIRDHRLGVLSLTFPGRDSLARPARQAFLATLADTLAQALERAMAASQAAAAGAKLAFLAEASGALSISLDISTALSEVARLAVPRLADWCVVHLLQDDGIVLVEMAHSDPARIAWAKETSRLYPSSNADSSGVARVISSGRSELHRTIPEQVLADAATDDAHLAMLRDLGMSSVVIAPLTGRNGTYGALTLLYTDSGRRYDAADLELAEDLARRVALAVETATAFAQQQVRLAAVSRVAEAAQRAILAEPPEEIGPVRLAARYVSATAEARIGGDLYEVVRRDGAVRLLIGDVRGKGLDAVRKATVVLGEFRSAAADDDDLVDVTAQLDRRLRSHLDAEDFVTALVVEIADDGRCTLASCGHPPAMLVSGGVVTPIDVEPSLPLGLGAVPTLRTLSLAPGDRVLLYTDGLVEARGPDRQFLDLNPLLAMLSGGDVPSALDRLLLGLRAATGQALGDDLALLLAEYSG